MTSLYFLRDFATTRALAGAALGILALDGIAVAADLPVKGRLAPAYDWSGFYLGAHVGYGDAQIILD